MSSMDEASGIQPSSWGEQDENGIDLARLRWNLCLTPDERLERHSRALDFVLECRRAADEARLSRLGPRA